jgi:predicted enzyme related to lactoylglutathione lyase
MSVTTSTAITGIDICGFLVSDAERALAFYRDKLGLVPTEIDEQARGAEFTLADGSTFGVWQTPEKNVGGFVMLAVADIHAKIAELQAAGVAISPVDETPVCHMAFGQDPDGNGFIIHQRK